MNAKWTAITAMWLLVTGLLAYTVAQTGNLLWGVIFFPAVLSFIAIMGDVSNAQ